MASAKRFADIARGTRAVQKVSLPLVGEEAVELGVRALNGMELGRVLADARAYALAEIQRTRGAGDARPIPEPKDGDRLYDLGLMVSTLAIACCAASDAGEKFFASPEEILEGLDADRIALLYEEQQAWQDRCSPRVSEMSGADFIALTYALAGEDEGTADGPFGRLRPSTRLSWARTISKLYVSSLMPKSQPSSGSDSGLAS